jgi:hypothetical protein
MFNRLFGVPAVLKGISIAVRRAAAFGATVHSATSLAFYRWGSAELTAAGFGPAALACRHRRRIALMRSCHESCPSVVL